jgi:hypothetical protein
MASRTKSGFGLPDSLKAALFGVPDIIQPVAQIMSVLKV